MHSIKKREQFELIIDTCSTSKQLLESIDKLAEHIQSDPKQIFTDYRITVPIQLGTENKQCVFPEFLAHKLKSKSGHLENFYQEHWAHFNIVDTNASDAYKAFYAFHATDFLGDVDTQERVLKMARELAESMGKTSVVSAITEHSLRQFIRDVQQLKTDFESHYEEQKISIANMRDSMVLHLRQTAKEAENNGDQTHYYITESKIDDIVDREVADMERITRRIGMGRHAKRFFEESPESFRFFMQAIYSDAEVNKVVSEQNGFRRFRRNKGERAIEDFLFDKRAESDPGRVTVIISEDQGARKAIQRLRHRSSNTIFCVNSHGFAKALQQFGVIDDIGEAISEGTLKETRAFHKRWVERNPGRAEEKATMDDILDPGIEQKWADRLVEVLKRGHWREVPEQSSLISR